MGLIALSSGQFCRPYRKQEKSSKANGVNKPKFPPSCTLRTSFFFWNLYWATATLKSLDFFPDNFAELLWAPPLSMQSRRHRGGPFLETNHAVHGHQDTLESSGMNAILTIASHCHPSTESPFLRQLMSLEFYGPPVQLETQHDDKLLGFHCNAVTCTIVPQLPEHSSQIKSPRSANDLTYSTPSWTSRSWLIRRGTRPSHL